MMNRSHAGSIWANPHLWRITIIMVACSLYYYLDVISGFAGWASLEDALGRLHDFHGLVFFAPVVYAAYVFGLRGALLVALIAMFILLPYAIFVTSYSNALYRPTAFGIILSAVGAAVAMLQRSEEQGRRGMKELECLYDVGKAAEESNSVDEFLSLAMEIIPKAMQYPERIRIRITVRNKGHESPDFKETPNKMRRSLVVGGDALGNIEIYCTCECRSLKDHGTLIETFAERISGAVRRIELEQSLKRYSEQLEEMGNISTRELEQAQ